LVIPPRRKLTIRASSRTIRALTIQEAGSMKTIPSYALYGDQTQASWSNAFDFEWIPQRSAPYNWDIQPHVHDAFIQILYVTSGSTEVTLDNAKWHARAPCLLVIPARTVHSLHSTSDINGTVITAAQGFLESLAGVAMPELVSVMRKPAVLLLDESTRHADALMPLMLCIEREWRTHAAGQMAAGMALIIALLVQISRIGSTPQIPAAAGHTRKAAQIQKFRALVDAHFKDHLTIEDYAGKLGISAGQLSRLTRELLGSSPLDVINARIIHEAERDLVYTSTTIKQLAGALGFEDEAYFGRFFRKHTGLSPKEFRRNALAELALPHQLAGTGP
jgi:AraC family transcriptional activator of pobA